MSESAGRPPSVSSVSSISLVEIKAESHLVLEAFLKQTLSTPHKHRPGRVGGAYRDQNKFSLRPQSSSKGGHESQSGDKEEKRNGMSDFFSQITLSRSKDPKSPLTGFRKTKPPLAEGSPSSSSDEDDSAKKWMKKKLKMKKKLTLTFFKKKEKHQKDLSSEDDPNLPPQKPSERPGGTGPESTQVISPSHPPQFYNKVAGQLEKIAKSNKKKTPSLVIKPPAEVCDKEAVVQQLVELICLEGDSMDKKIQADPFLRSSLNRLSYASFAKVLDVFGGSEVSETPPLPPSRSPTLQRMAISMEVSRQIVTATGSQRTKGYAERYMESFAPWVKSHGGWENVVDFDDVVECD